MYIAFEGIDGAGKTTLAKGVAKELKKRGYRVLLVKEPSSTVFGRLIRRLVALTETCHVEALLFTADRIHQYNKVLKPWLDLGGIVISDRSVFSTLAYQSVRGASMRWLLNLCEVVPFPDLVVLIDIEPEVGLSRIVCRDVSTMDRKFEQLNLLKKVRRNYLTLAKRFKQFRVIKSNKKDDTLQRALAIVLSEVTSSHA